ncbi:hypothetical protein JZ751_000686 [Albula glossodonta]|uniref:Ethanolaminephosphotransferase 1 n=1 Tax=Albula glossodonta TaxID=121402 RepID=A0A8T2PX19_9TELE|nr:hypothetical protein JZ751_000686 [Albula glossodonta]
MFNYNYVTSQQLAGFDKYKVVPLWIAPNLLTFSGFLLILINYLLLSFYDWNYTASDSIDGKHARRTMSSSPLGELFDHGLDSWATSLFTLSLFSVFGISVDSGVSAYTLYCVLCVILLTFIISHWEKYNTGVLFLPWGYDISQLTLTAVYLLTAVIGVEAWHKPLPFGYFFTDILIAMVIEVSVSRAHKRGSLLRNSLYEGLLPLLSPCLLFTLLTTWAVMSPSNVLTQNPRSFLWMTGVAFSNCRLIICQMTNTRTEAFHWLLLPLAGITSGVVVGIPAQIEFLCLMAYSTLVTVAHIHYGVCVGRQLSKHLNIYIFSLGKRHQE